MTFYTSCVRMMIDSRKVMNMRDQLIKALLAHAQGDIQKHVANVEVYLTNPAGIGEHSNIVEAIEEELNTVSYTHLTLPTIYSV